MTLTKRRCGLLLVKEKKRQLWSESTFRGVWIRVWWLPGGPQCKRCSERLDWSLAILFHFLTHWVLHYGSRPPTSGPHQEDWYLWQGLLAWLLDHLNLFNVEPSCLGLVRMFGAPRSLPMVLSSKTWKMPGRWTSSCQCTTLTKWKALQIFPSVQQSRCALCWTHWKKARRRRQG